MENLKKDYTFWELIGCSKKNLLCVEDILDIGKSKSKKRKDEAKINRSKNHKFSELSAKELTNTMFIYKKIFNDFCKEFVCKEDSKLIKEFIYLFEMINYILEFENLSRQKLHPKIIIKNCAYYLAKFINEFSKDKESLIIYNLLGKKSFESIFNLMNNEEQKTIPELLAINNYILETKFLQKYNIRIETKHISSFQSTLSSWKNKKRPLKIVDILHFIENINEDIKIEIFFQLLLFRSILFLKNKYKLNEKNFKKIINISKYFLKKIENKKIIKKNTLIIFSNDYKKDEEFGIDKFYISNKEIENLFTEKRYSELIELLQIEYINFNFDNNLEKSIYKIHHFLIIFIICTKIRNKFLMEESFKAVSLSLFLEYRGFKYNSENIINLLNNEDNLFNCVKILNDYFSKNVDFSLMN